MANCNRCDKKYNLKDVISKEDGFCPDCERGIAEHLDTTKEDTMAKSQRKNNVPSDKTMVPELISGLKKEDNMELYTTFISNDKKGTGFRIGRLKGVFPGGVLQVQVLLFHNQLDHIQEIKLDGALGLRVKNYVRELKDKGTLEEQACVRECANDVSIARVVFENTAYDVPFMNKHKELTVIGTSTKSVKKKGNVEETRWYRNGMCRVLGGNVEAQVEMAIAEMDFSADEESEDQVLEQ